MSLRRRSGADPRVLAWWCSAGVLLALGCGACSSDASHGDEPPKAGAAAPTLEGGDASVTGPAGGSHAAGAGARDAGGTSGGASGANAGSDSRAGSGGTAAEAGSSGTAAEAGAGGTAAAGSGASASAGRAAMQCKGASCYWTRQLGTSGEDSARRVAVDVDGSVYVTGFAGPGFGGQVGLGAGDAYLLKLDAHGETLWTRVFGSDQSDFSDGLAIAANGDVYVAGATAGSIDGRPHAGEDDLFVARFDATGKLAWLRQLGTSEIDIATDLALGPDGSVYVAGLTVGVLDGTSNAGRDDLLVAKLDEAGATVWIRQFGSAEGDAATAIIADASGVYVSARSRGVLDGTTASSPEARVVLKYSHAGEREWVHQLGPLHQDSWAGIALAHDGSALVSGSSAGINGAPTLRQIDVFIAKYDPAGERKWTQTFGLTANEVSYSIATDATGGIYSAGYTDARTNDAAGGGADVLLIKTDAVGVQQWARQFGSAATDLGLDVEVDRFYDIYVAGETSGGLDGHTNAGGLDLFITKRTRDGVVP